MDMDQLRQRFPDERTCIEFFETVRWPSGQVCPHCGFLGAYRIKPSHQHRGRYECKRCTRHYTVTTKTVLHSTNLPLWKWLQAMYLIITSSKGISSVVLARLIGVTQPTAWRMGHVIRKMMDPIHADADLLRGIVEIDETYIGGRPQPGAGNKRGKGTAKQ